MSVATKNKPKATKLPPVVALTIPEREVRVIAREPVRLEDLWFDDKSDRLPELVDAARIDELALAMARQGLQHPIQVTRFGAPHNKYRVVFGGRRVRAAQRLDWKSIDATHVEFTSEDQVLAAREVENIQRQDLNPMEEAIAVSNMLNLEASRHGSAAGGHQPLTYVELLPELKRQAVAAVAVRLAKGEGWVRDRAFLAKLSGETRKAVLDGRLPLGHAREIAKIADPKMRDEIAEQVAADPKHDMEAMNFDEVQNLVRNKLYSLAQVSWAMDKAFAGAPACVDCPSNSLNNPGLFEHGGMFVTEIPKSDNAYLPRSALSNKEPKQGVCTDRGCFARKAAAAGQAMTRAAAVLSKAVKAAPPKKKAEAREQALQKVPEFLDRDAVEAKAAAKPKPKAKAAKTSKPSAYKPAQRSPRQIAEDKLIEARRDRIKSIESAMAKHFKTRPGAWAVFKLFTETKIYQATNHYSDVKRQRAVDSPELSAALKRAATADWDSILALEKSCGTQYGLLDVWNDGRSGMGEKIAEAFGLDVGPAPKLEDFLPKGGKDEKAKAAADVEAKPVKAKPGRARPIVDDGEGGE